MAPRSDFEVWLDDQSRETRLLVAARAAARCLPVLGDPKLGSVDKKYILGALRAVLGASVSAKFSGSQIESAMRSTSLSTDELLAEAQSKTDLYTAEAFHSAACSIHECERARAAEQAVGRSISANAVAAGRVTADAAAQPAAELTRLAAIADAALPIDTLDSSPIWKGGTRPELGPFTEPVPDWAPSNPLSFELRLNGPEWDFWNRWYDGWLTGKQVDWDLQKCVALIDSNTWSQGPLAVASRIEECKAKILSAKLPLAESISINPDTGCFKLESIAIKNEPFFGALLSRVTDSLEDALQNNNGLREDSREVRVLRRTLNQYADDPQRIELDFTSVAVGLQRQLRETQELPDNEDNRALLEALEEAVRGIRANHPDVAANREQLAIQGIRELPVEEKQALSEAQLVLVAVSEGQLKEDFATDVPELTNDASSPTTGEEATSLRADSAIRVFGRASRMRPKLDKAKEQLEKLEARCSQIWDSDRVKTLRLAALGFGTIGFVLSVFSWLVNLGLRLLGVL